MKMRCLVAAAAVWTLGLAGTQPARADDFKRELIKGALGKSLPLMMTSAERFEAARGKECASCHHQMAPSIAYDAAKKMGFAVDEKRWKRQSDFSYRFVTQFASAIEQAQNGDPAALEKLGPLGDPATFTLPLYSQVVDGRPRDHGLEVLTLFMARAQADDGRWLLNAARPPMESSEFTTTAQAVRVMTEFGGEANAAELRGRLAKAREWLLHARPKTTEDKTFRLFGLKWAGADAGAVRQAGQDLLDDQRDDGAWAQLPGKAGDAYATGEVLVALYESGVIPATDSAYQRGVMYLGMTQQKDGSWLVAKRAPAVQPYFDSGFPGGKAQYISIVGTAWASAAIAYGAGPAPAKPATTASR